MTKLAKSSQSPKKKNPVGGSKPGERRGGRKKGTPNKVTADVKAAIAKIAEDNAGTFQAWLNRVAKEDPAKACDIYLKALEYHVPKLQRTDLTSGGKKLPRNVNINVIPVSAT